MEAKLRRELDDIMEKEEILCYQKLRIERLKNSDRNTTNFHLSTIIRRWNNKMMPIKDSNDSWISDTELIRAHLVDYYSMPFTKEGNNQYGEIPNDVFEELPLREWETLSKLFTTIETYIAAKQLGALKALSPDGFQGIFYQKHWNVVAKYVHKMALDVLTGKGIPEHLNETHLVLIPKVDHPEYASQFRPIGLCNVAYKIISKVLVNRIKPHLPFFISNTQPSFVPSRQITDNIVIV